MARSNRLRRQRPPALERLEERCLLSYTITDLGTLGGNTSYAFGINNADPVQVVGESNIGPPGSPFRAFVWDSINGLQDLGTLGGSGSVAYAINDVGQVVGYSSTPTPFAEQAFLWDSTNGMQSLGALPGSRASRAFAINNAGQVTGWSGSTYFLDGHAVLWDGGTATDLGTVNNYPSAGKGIDASGQVVGTAGPVGDFHALLWDNGSMQDLGALSGWGSTAAAINHRGHITGIAYVEPVNGLFLSNPYLYTSGRGLTDLGTLDCPPGYLGYGVGEAINDHNQVVGLNGCVTPQLPLQSYDFATVWTPGVGWQALDSLIPPDSGWTLKEATGVNDRGEIVGYGLIDDQTHAFLLTPSDGGSAVPLRVDPISVPPPVLPNTDSGRGGQATAGVNELLAGLPTAPPQLGEAPLRQAPGIEASPTRLLTVPAPAAELVFTDPAADSWAWS